MSSCCCVRSFSEALCPRNIIELRKKGPKGRRVYVSCVNKDKGPAAMKACAAACIGCGKCQKECAFEAITIANNVSYIDPDKCRLCRKCEKVCPTHAIIAVNFPAPKPRPAAETEAAKTETAIDEPSGEILTSRSQSGVTAPADAAAASRMAAAAARFVILFIQR